MMMLTWQFLVIVAQDAIGGYEPKTWIGLLGLLVIVIPTLVAAVPGWINLWRNRSVPAQVAAVKDQVQNGHSERNLRCDMDRMINMAEDTRRDIHGLREDIGGLRGELREERETRTRADVEINAAIRRIRHQLDHPRPPQPPPDDDDE